MARSVFDKGPLEQRRDAHGKLNFWFVLPTEALRSLVIRRLRQKFPELNYGVTWKDTNGYGLQMTVAEWMNGQPYSDFYWCR